jgi:hypothetical protein
MPFGKVVGFVRFLKFKLGRRVGTAYEQGTTPNREHTQTKIGPMPRPHAFQLHCFIMIRLYSALYTDKPAHVGQMLQSGRRGSASASSHAPGTRGPTVPGFRPHQKPRALPTLTLKDRGLLCTARAGLLDFLTPTFTTTKKAVPAKQLVDDLIAVASKTDAGISASQSVRSEIEALVEEVEKYCPKAPLRSELIFGQWEVLYASKPGTAGGPFRSPLGRIVFPGQKARQTIAPPDIVINEVSYKALGFVPGSARQEGEIETVDEYTFKIIFPQLANKVRAAGGPPERFITTTYLDDRIRIARTVPASEDEETSYYVFRRVVDGKEEDENEEQAQKTQNRKVETREKGTQVRKSSETVREPERSPGKRATPAFFGTQIFSRSSAKNDDTDRESPAQKGKRAQIPPKSSKTEAISRKSREEMAAERKRAQEAAKAEREAAAKRRAEAQEQYRQLNAQALEAATEARTANAAVVSLERSATKMLKAAAAAQSMIERAFREADMENEKLLAAQAEEVEAEKQVLEAQRRVNDLELQLRRTLSSVAPSLRK